jgi:hypothetical protein
MNMNQFHSSLLAAFQHALDVQYNSQIANTNIKAINIGRYQRSRQH